jgi:hypothetical protein
MYGVGYIGQTHYTTHTATVTSQDVINELTHRGYERAQPVTVVHDVVAPIAPTLTKAMAISVAIDEALDKLNVPHSSAHPYRCPAGSCPVNQATYDSIVSWCVAVANGYLSQQYSLPSWARSMLHSGTLRGLSGLSGHFGGWLQDNPWVVQSIGDVIGNYGDWLTAQNVQDAIKAVEKNTAGSLSKDDIPALVAALTQAGYIKAGQEGTVAAGAQQAASKDWMMYAVIGLVALMVVMMMGKR